MIVHSDDLKKSSKKQWNYPMPAALLYAGAKSRSRKTMSYKQGVKDERTSMA
jgi:hypothetical protein